MKKFFTIYRAKVGGYRVSYTIKGSKKLRTHAVTGGLQECYDRFTAKGYKFFDKYNHKLFNA